MTDTRLRYPATARNREPILAVLREHLPPTGIVLEIASGSGEHVVHFAKAFPALSFHPSDPEPGARASIDAWAAHEGLTNVARAMPLDVTAATPWPLARADVILCINMIHISPWAATQGLMRGAASVLAPGGLLYLYGPYKQGGGHTAPSNEAFDADLRARNPAWGVRDLETVTAEAEAVGLKPAAVIAMPANNLSVLFRKPS
jgi:SAM-dependent methyltransferase